MGGISISYDFQAQIQVYVECPIYLPLCKTLLSPPKETYAGVQKNGRRTSNIQFLMATSDTCQYFGHLMWKTDSLEKTLMLRKIEGGLLPFFFANHQSFLIFLKGDDIFPWAYFNHLTQSTSQYMFHTYRREQQRIRWLDGITDSMDMSLSKARSWW